MRGLATILNETVILLPVFSAPSMKTGGLMPKSVCLTVVFPLATTSPARCAGCANGADNLVGRRAVRRLRSCGRWWGPQE